MLRQNLSLNITAIFCLLLVSNSFANSKVSLPNVLNKNNVQLVGEAQFSVMFWDIYQSRLYTTSGQFDGVNSSVIFEILYQRDISKAQLIDRTIEQWQKMQVSPQHYRQFIPSLEKLWPDIVSGDVLALKVAEKSSHFYFNNQYLGSIPSEQFASLFLGIWLAPNTTQPAFRQKLIAGKS